MSLKEKEIELLKRIQAQKVQKPISNPVSLPKENKDGKIIAEMQAKIVEELLLKQGQNRSTDCQFDDIKKKLKSDSFTDYADIKNIEFIHSRFFS